jgi:Skp family chaperone for outer membrane proteins
MKLNHLASASVVLTAVLAFSAQAVAQTAPAVTGPVIPGICVFNPARAVGASTVGKYVTGRLNELGQQVNAELQAEQAQIQTEAKALEAQRATLTQAQLQAKGEPLQARAAAFQRKVQLRDKEMQETQSRAVQQIAQTMGPIAVQTFTQRGCSVLLNTDALSLFVPGAEITDSVIAGLNVKMQTLAVERVHLDQAAPAAAAPARR